MTITNPQIAQDVSDLITHRVTIDTQFATWLSGPAGGGQFSDGRYPLSDYTGVERLVESPDQLASGIGGSAAAAAASAAAALASENAAASSASAASTDEGLADAHRIAAIAAQSAAETARDAALSAQANATASQLAAATSESNAATSESNAAASEAAAAASESAAAASAAAAATFDPALYHALADVGEVMTGTLVSTNNANVDGPNFDVQTTNKSNTEYAYKVTRNAAAVGGFTTIGRAMIEGTIIGDTEITNWNTAYGWGNHAGAYLPLGGGTITGNVIFDSDYPVIDFQTRPAGSGSADLQFKEGTSLKAILRWNAASNQLSFMDRDPSNNETANFDFDTGDFQIDGVLTSANIAPTGTGLSSGNDLDDYDDATEQGFYGWGGSLPANAPFTYANMLAKRDSNQMVQLVWGGSGNARMAVRRFNSGVPGAWSEFASLLGAAFTGAVSVGNMTIDDASFDITATDTYYDFQGRLDSAGGIRLQNNSGGNKGYIYYNASHFGLLNSGGSWAVRIPHGGTSVETIGLLTASGGLTVPDNYAVTGALKVYEARGGSGDDPDTESKFFTDSIHHMHNVTNDPGALGYGSMLVTDNSDVHAQLYLARDDNGRLYFRSAAISDFTGYQWNAVAFSNLAETITSNWKFEAKATFEAAAGSVVQSLQANVAPANSTYIPAIRWEFNDGTVVGAIRAYRGSTGVDNLHLGVNWLNTKLVLSGSNTHTMTGGMNMSGNLESPKGIFGSLSGNNDAASLPITGGLTGGANIQLYGSTHASLANDAYYDADQHNFRTVAASVQATLNATRFTVVPELRVTDQIESYDVGGKFMAGTNSSGISGVLGSTQHTDSSSLRYRTYWSYDCYWDDSADEWLAKRTSLGRKWKAEMGYHGDSFDIDRFDGTVSAAWADSDWTNLFSLGNTGILTLALGINIVDGNTTIREGAANAVRLSTDDGYCDIGPQNSSYCHIQTDISAFYMNKRLDLASGARVYQKGALPYYDSSSDTGGKITVSGTAPSSPTQGDIWFDTS